MGSCLHEIMIWENYDNVWRSLAEGTPMVEKARSNLTTSRVNESVEVPLQVTVPPKVKHALDLKAAETGKTKRTLVLEALRTIGIDVEEQDIARRRGARR